LAQPAAGGGVVIRRVSALTLLALFPGISAAQGVQVEGFGDVRLEGSSGDRTSFQGGLGKLQWNGNGEDFRAEPEFEQLLLAASAGLTPELRGFADLRWDPNLRTELDLLDAFLRWRPVSTTNWRWSVKLGAFFPPISLENGGIGWTSPWTLTPSAINSWVGDELRTIGGEAGLEWRNGVTDIQLSGAVYGWDDPAGVQLAHFGWVFTDQPAGLFGQAHQPDLGDSHHADTAPAPAYAPIFREIDARPGWYGNLSWSEAGLGLIQLMRYDNRVDTDTEAGGQYPWHTQFWSLGARTEFGEFTVLAQGMIGQTRVTPDDGSGSTTSFHAAYLLIGWERDEWRFAERLDQFGTSERQTGYGPDLSEHGWSPVTAVTWKPLDWLRLTAEALVVESWRVERLEEGLSPRALETQLQLGARAFF
jgi:hypothetical protein